MPNCPGFDTLSNNATGFSGLPAGLVSSEGFGYMGYSTVWWALNIDLDEGDYGYTLGHSSHYLYYVEGIGRGGASIRCIQGVRERVIPSMRTLPVTDITSTIAVSGIEFTVGYAWYFGLCWSTSPNPTLEDNFVKISHWLSDPSLISIEGLNPGTKYYIKSYGTNGFGTGYGNEISFTTLP